MRRKLYSIFRYCLIRFVYRFSRKVKVHNSAVIRGYDNLTVGACVQIQSHVIIHAFNKLNIGVNTQLNPFTVIYTGSPIHIGSNVMIGPHCVLTSGKHDHNQTSKPMRFAESISKGPITIDDDVWIGANVTIADGIHIGCGAVIGANSFVNKDVPSYGVVGGVPAKIISKRKMINNVL